MWNVTATTQHCHTQQPPPAMTSCQSPATVEMWSMTSMPNSLASLRRSSDTLCWSSAKLVPMSITINTHHSVRWCYQMSGENTLQYRQTDTFISYTDDIRIWTSNELKELREEKITQNKTQCQYLYQCKSVGLPIQQVDKKSQSFDLYYLTLVFWQMCCLYFEWIRFLINVRNIWWHFWIYCEIIILSAKETAEITVGTGVHTVLTATSQSNGNGQTLTPHKIRTP